MKVESLIPAFWFYIGFNEKHKLNWFTYELACKFFEHINDSRKPAVKEWKAQRSDEQIAEFCAYYAKRVRRSMLNVLSKAEKDIRIEEEYVRDYCHTNTRRDNDAIHQIVLAALKELTDNCGVCPVKCLSEIYMYCEFFDRMERGGYLS